MTSKNLQNRIIVSVIFIPLILLVSYIGKLPLLAFITLLSVFIFKEYSSIVKKKDIRINEFFAYPASAVIIINFYFEFIDPLLLFILFTITGLVLELLRKTPSAEKNYAHLVLGLLYFGIFPGTIIGMREFMKPETHFYEQGGLLLIALWFSIWFLDSTAYFMGKAFGRKKAYPHISPAKTWEGTIAGFASAVLSMIACKALFLDFFSWIDVIVFGIVTGIIGQFGDLFESLIKRETGTKDSSGFIPGHGGLFDRFDSILLTAPVIYLYLKFFY